MSATDGTGSRTGVGAAALMAAAGIGIGAFGAHGLEGVVTDPGMLANFETGTRYWMYGALALLALTVVGIPRLATGLLAGGAAVFAGSLWVMALTGARWLGAITPIGGVGMIAGLVVAAVSLIRR